MVRTVLIVDDHASFWSLARTILEADAFEVVGEAADGVSALDRVRTLKPDLVLLDIQLPDLDGFAVCDHLALEAQPPPVVLTSTRDISSYRRRLAQSSARGFIAKSDLTGVALAAIVEHE